MESPWKLIAANGAVADLDDLDPGRLKVTGTLKANDEGYSLKRMVEHHHADAKPCIVLPEVVIYEHIDFGGALARTNLAWKYVGSYWNDKVSSIVVASGTWRFYQHANYGGAHWDLPPGYYRWVVDVGIPNDTISSFKPIKLC